MNGLLGRPMRLLMTADGVGGVWEYALELARGLAPQGIEVVLATMGRPPDDGQRRAAASVPGLELEESAFGLEWMPEAEADIAAAGAWLLELEARHRPDLVHLNGYAHAALPWSTPTLLAAHSCVVTWWSAVHGCLPPPTWEAYRRRVRDGLTAAGLVVAPSAAFARCLAATYEAGRPIRVIHNGRDPAGYAPRAKEPFVFAAGRLWDEGKNLEALAAIAPELAWPVVIAGDREGPQGRQVSFDGAQLLGPLDHGVVAERMARAAIFAWPARYEPFGLAVLEAALSGCALVLGDIPSLRELWEDAAVFVDPTDGRALRVALDGLIEGPRHRAALGAAARRRALRYGSARTADAYAAAYAELLPVAAGVAA